MDNTKWQLGKWQQFGVGLAIAASVLGGGILFRYSFINKIAKDWGQDVRYYSELYPEDKQNTTKVSESINAGNTQSNLNIHLQQFKSDPESRKLRVKEQLEITRSRARTHLRATKDFYIWSSLVSGIALMGSVISAICLLHITREGWKSSNATIQGIFVASAGTFAFCSSSILLYEYEQNTLNNATLYVYYVNLEDDIITALANQSPLSPSLPELMKMESEPMKTEEVSLSNLKLIILEIQKRLNDAHTLDIKFDLDQDLKIKDLLPQSDVQQ